MWGMMQFMLGTFNLVIIGYTYYIYKIDPNLINLYDYFDYYLQILLRSVVVGAKYGFFSEQTWTILGHGNVNMRTLDSWLINLTFK